MDSVYNKKCYFLLNEKYYSGTIMKHKKNKYLIKTNREIFMGCKCLKIISLDIKDIYFGKDMEKIIENQICLYIAEALINNESTMMGTMKTLCDLFPSKSNLKEIKLIVQNYYNPISRNKYDKFPM